MDELLLESALRLAIESYQGSNEKPSAAELTDRATDFATFFKIGKVVYREIDEAKAEAETAPVNVTSDCCAAATAEDHQAVLDMIEEAMDRISEEEADEIQIVLDNAVVVVKAR